MQPTLRRLAPPKSQVPGHGEVGRARNQSAVTARSGRAEINVRKDIFGYDTLAWALFKTGHYPEAADAIIEAMKLGTQDAGIHYHAGMIFHRLGDDESARIHLSYALELSPHFSVLHVDTAERLLASLDRGTASLAADRQVIP